MKIIICNLSIQETNNKLHIEINICVVIEPSKLEEWSSFVTSGSSTSACKLSATKGKCLIVLCKLSFVSPYR